MPIGTMSFPILTPQQTSPFGGALSDAIAKRLALAQAQSEEAKVPYAGISSLADALSKSAYAQSVVPQFQAKLMAHPEILANIRDPQQRLNAMLAMGGPNGLSGGPSGQLNAYLGQELQRVMEKQSAQNQGGLGQLGEGLAGLFGMNRQESQNQQMAPQSPPMMQQEPSPVMQTDQSGQNIVPNAPSYTMSTPEEAASEGIVNVSPTSAENEQFAENAARYKGTVAKGEAAGKEAGQLREKQIDEYGDAYQGLLDQKNSIKNLENIFQEPVLERIANTPFANSKAISFYKNSGTPEEKRALGKLESSMNQFIAESIKSFGSRFTNRDLMFLQTMKPNDSDLMDVRKGKLESLKLFNELHTQKMKMAHNLMKSGLDKLEAEDLANKKLNIDQIQERISTEISPPPVKIKKPDGTIISLPKKGAELLLRDHPEMHEVVQ